jgi:GT2 family glycosyltransferase
MEAGDVAIDPLTVDGPHRGAIAGPSLAAIVPATDRPPTLERCVAAIRAAQEPPDEIIVVDQPAGAGAAAARNAGVARSRAEVLAFVDSDVVVRPETFARMRRAFAADRELCAVFGSYDDSPEAPGAVSGFRNLLHHHVHQSCAGRARTFWAGLGGVRRDAFVAAGGFDEDRYSDPSIEDIELGMRLADTGARIELDPALQGTHLKAWTLADAVRTDFARRGVPWVRLLWERRRIPTDLNLGWRHRASAAATLLGLAAIAVRRPVPAAAAALTLVALNRSLYALLLRRRGPAQAVAGIGLHALHHAVGVVSVPAGLLTGYRHRPTAPPARARALGPTAGAVARSRPPFA